VGYLDNNTNNNMAEVEVVEVEVDLVNNRDGHFQKSCVTNANSMVIMLIIVQILVWMT
jgi:hypothetical protein